MKETVISLLCQGQNSISFIEELGESTHFWLNSGQMAHLFGRQSHSWSVSHSGQHRQADQSRGLPAILPINAFSAEVKFWSGGHHCILAGHRILWLLHITVFGVSLPPHFRWPTLISADITLLPASQEPDSIAFGQLSCKAIIALLAEIDKQTS